MTAVGLQFVPAEVTEHALIHTHPRDVASFAQTCRFARALVYQSGDQHLWRQLFLLHPFDDPRNLPGEPGWQSQVDWMSELQRRIRAANAIYNLHSRPDGLLDALQTLVSVVESAAHVTADSNSPSESYNLEWLCQLLRSGDLFRSYPWTWTQIEEQYIAQLYSYIGWRNEDSGSSRREKTRNVARGFVYDLRNYTRQSRYGPFLPDGSGRVNWKHVESIITVVDCNIWDNDHRWKHTRPPRSLDSLRAYSAPGVLKRDERDWAGVEGTWRRYVCFMDYRDLFAYNFSTASNGAYDLSFFEDEDFQEATRLIELTLKITRISSTCIYFDRPTIFFAGTSRGADGNEAIVRGQVCMTPDGQIRWRFASIHDGVTQWSSEGVQIGNVASAAGIVGTWTGAQHDDGDPAGPFWLWKVEKDHPSAMDGAFFFD